MNIENPNELEKYLSNIQSLTTVGIIEKLDYSLPEYITSKTALPLSKEALLSTEKIFTNLNSPVSAFKIGGLLQGMVICKQSRAADDSRVILARMIEANKNLSSVTQQLNIPDFLNEVGYNFYESVFNEYGDDSVARVAEFGAVFEGVSQLEAMMLLHHRVLFGIEKSTRYMDYSKKTKNGTYNYIVDPSIRSTSIEHKFRKLTDSYFDIYASLINKSSKEHIALDAWLKEELPFDIYADKVQDWLKNHKQPLASKEELIEAYARTLSASFKDQIRHLLPLSSRTSLGLAFNSEALRHMVYQSQSRSFPEGILIGELLRRELSKLAGPLLKDTEANNKHGKEFREFLFSTRKPLENYHAPEELIEKPISYDRQLKLPINSYGNFLTIRDEKLDLDVMLRVNGSIDELVASILCERASHFNFPYAERLAKVMSKEEKLSYVYDSLGIGYVLERSNIIAPKDKIELTHEDIRKNRRHRPSRAFEKIIIDNTLIMPIAEIRDIRRHTLQSYLDPLYFTPSYGFYTSPGLKAVSLETKIDALNQYSKELWHEVNDSSGPFVATTCLPMSARAPMNTSYNLREAYHILELRTQVGAAPVYLRVGQMIYAGLSHQIPEIAATMKFVNRETEIDYGRAVQEIRAIARKRTERKIELA